MKYIFAAMLTGFTLVAGRLHAQPGVPPQGKTPARETWYFDKNGARLPSAEGADHRTEIIFRDSVAGSVRDYYASGTLKRFMVYGNLRSRLLHGNCTWWYESGQLRRQAAYVAGRLHGELRSFYSNGTPKRREVYDHGKRVLGESFGSDGLPVPYQAYDEAASYQAGTPQMAYDLQHYLRYPADALRAGAKGRVLIGFDVEADGTVAGGWVVHSPSQLLNEAALQGITHLGRFNPALVDGEAMRSSITFPVVFAIK